MQTTPDFAVPDAEAFKASGVVARVAYPVFRSGVAEIAPGPVRSGARLCKGLSLFHDANEDSVTLTSSEDGLVLGIADEPVDYLSVSAKLPPAASAEIGPGRLLDVALLAETQRAVPVYFRLNLETQPEPVVLHDLVICSDIPRSVTFNFDAVAYPLDDARDGAWVDVIFSKPGGRRIKLQDLTLAIRIQGWPRDLA